MRLADRSDPVGLTMLPATWFDSDVQVHALFAETEALLSVAALRAELDPDRAARFPLHVTVAYAPQRIASTQAPIPRGTLELGAVEAWSRPDIGIYLSVADQQDWLRSLRLGVGDPGTFGHIPHVTLLHHTAFQNGHDVDEIRRRFQQVWTPTTANVAALVTVDDAGVVLDHVSLQ